MTLEQMIAMMTMNQVEGRMAAIRTELDGEGADLDALNHEVDLLEARRAELGEQQTRVEARAALMQRVGRGDAGNPIRSFQNPETPPEQRSYDASCPEYRTAWLKNVAVRDNVPLFGDMTTEERAAFTYMTSNTQAVVPTTIQNRIIELVESDYPMYADATKGNMTSGFSIPRHKAIVAGDAAKTDEGAANPDSSKDDFDLLTLTGVEIKKHIEISRKMKWQSIDAFETWLVRSIAERIGVAKEDRIRSQLDDPTYGIDSENVLVDVSLDDAGIRGVFAKIKGTGTKVVYANSSTIWAGIAGIEQGDGTKAFIPSTMSDPVTQGRIYGAEVKKNDNLADNVAYIGIPRHILANNFEDIFINHTMDPRTFVDIVAGYSLFDAGLENPKAFVKVTFKSSAAVATVDDAGESEAELGS